MYSGEIARSIPSMLHPGHPDTHCTESKPSCETTLQSHPSLALRGCLSVELCQGRSNVAHHARQAKQKISEHQHTNNVSATRDIRRTIFRISPFSMKPPVLPVTDS